MAVIKPEPRDYAELLESIGDRPDAEMLQTMLLRSMKQAIYDPENRGHFGLALQSYAHFTSPIRRYPDLSLHRAIKYLLAQEQGHKGNTTETGGYHYSMEEMLQLGQHCSMAERRADEATRDVADWLKCDFMLDQVGNVFKGVIASVTGFGFFVRLDELFIDGLVHVSSLDNDYYRFDQVGQRLIGESGGQTYRLGDRVEVKVEAVNMDDRKIDFSLISSERAPRNVGKTAREKTKKGGNGNSGGKRRQAGKKVNFEPDSAFRGEKKQKPKAAKKEARKAKKPSTKTQKIAAATGQSAQRRNSRRSNSPPQPGPSLLRREGKEKTEREPSMSEMIYGIHAVQALLERAPERFQEVFILKGREDKRLMPLIHALEAQGVVIQLANRQFLDEKSEGAVHQGIIARVKPGRQYQENDLPDLIAGLENPFFLILDGVTDPHNLGACLRSADAAGVHAVIVPRDRSAQLNATAKKVACGAAENVPLIRVTNLARTMRMLQEENIWIVGTAGEADHTLYQSKMTGPSGPGDGC